MMVNTIRLTKHLPYFLSAEQIDDFGIIRITWVKETEVAARQLKRKMLTNDPEPYYKKNSPPAQLK